VSLSGDTLYDEVFFEVIDSPVKLPISGFYILYVLIDSILLRRHSADTPNRIGVIQTGIDKKLPLFFHGVSIRIQMWTSKGRTYAKNCRDFAETQRSQTDLPFGTRIPFRLGMDNPRGIQKCGNSL
jgi:hypothetical protein